MKRAKNESNDEEYLSQMIARIMQSRKIRDEAKTKASYHQDMKSIQYNAPKNIKKRIKKSKQSSAKKNIKINFNPAYNIDGLSDDEDDIIREQQTVESVLERSHQR